ncbi:hypothetical protein FNYG_15516 [Fusarium nygamai]|uniref:D-serine dehydratase n=1 Tax=Gibberella nygamai TaxID=42673 RepID=A0A2K0UC87_GIBNY|nr:hypothetical protein FNYG_15516 [Fusarium nygamai]
MSSSGLYPSSAKAVLRLLYVGKLLHEVPSPGIVLDVDCIRRNCQSMLEACDSMSVAWRAHIKTHKTIEVSRLQVGADPNRPANFVVSTIAELEFILPLLKEYGFQCRQFNVIYGFPISPEVIPRLANLAAVLGNGSVGILVDHLAQIEAMEDFYLMSGGVVPQVHIKIDVGGRRTGVIPGSETFRDLVESLLEAHEGGFLVLSGLYSHAGHSYAGNSRAEAVSMLETELQAMMLAADYINAQQPAAQPLPLTLSAGASPTALSIQNLTLPHVITKEEQAASRKLLTLLATIREKMYAIELHAGVYPLLDLQQLAANSAPDTILSWDRMALTVLAEVCSVYPDRGIDGRPEILIRAGTLVLGREPCKAYPGLGIVTPWGMEDSRVPSGNVGEAEGWIVDRFSQEHGVLVWTGKAGEHCLMPLRVGQKIRLWPNHACITASHFDWYYVVDGSEQGEADKVVDIWVRVRGW